MRQCAFGGEVYLTPDGAPRMQPFRPHRRSFGLSLSRSRHSREPVFPSPLEKDEQSLLAALK